MIRIKGLIFIAMIFAFSMQEGYAQDTRQYDEDIKKQTAKIRQYPGRTKNLDKLKESYVQANAIDNSRISGLLLTGQPDIWYEVYSVYLKMKRRQETVMTLPEKTRQESGIEFADYTERLAECRYKATAYLYAHGEKLLLSDKPEDARQAYSEFLKVVELDPSYGELDKAIRNSILKAATHLEFEMHNRSGKVVSSAMIDQLSSIIWEFKRAKYGQVKPEKVDPSFTFILRVILDEIEIGPDQVKELQYQEERDVYRDNIVVDTLKCLVMETRQLKRARLSGSLEYVDKQTGRVVNRIPIKVESVFFNVYATLQDDPQAAGDETRKLLMAKRAPYPSNEQMILDATEEFTKKAKDVILAD